MPPTLAAHEEFYKYCCIKELRPISSSPSSSETRR